MEFSKILLIGAVFIFSHVVGKPQLDLRILEELEIGDDCELFDGTKGNCMVDRECPYIIDLIHSRQKDKIRRCGFSGMNQVVCCGVKTESQLQPIEIKTRNSFCGSTEKRQPKPIVLEYHIIRGNQAEPSEFPFMAALGYDTSFGDFEFKCGGTLITENFVLTAAHCVSRIQPKIVRLGKTSLKDDRDEYQAQDIGVGNIISKSDYSSRTKLNDIALLKLARSAVLAYNVFPACISGGDKALSSGGLTIIGFGKVMNDDDGSVSDWLQKAETTEIPIEECQQKFKSILGSKQITETQLCAFNNTIRSDSCQGDSGAPIFYREGDQAFIYGITSYGIGCGGEIPSVYTRVDKYLDWIKEMLKS